MSKRSIKCNYVRLSVSVFSVFQLVDPLMPGGNENVTHA